MLRLEHTQEEDIPEHGVSATAAAAAGREGRYLRHVLPQHSQRQGHTCPRIDLQRRVWLVRTQ